jgi:flavin reductase (DIM6/NTAB) family NADH-FMN oxidoreductase RutF
MKLEPPFYIDPKGVIHGKDGETFVTKGINVTGIDSDGYVRLDIMPMSTSQNPDLMPPKMIGSVSAKSRVYDLFSIGNEFRVVIHGPQGSRVVTKRITHQFLSQVFLKISKHPEVRFNELRSELPQVKDSLQLKASLAILQNTNHVECTREGKFSYYRKVKDWSLTLFQ